MANALVVENARILDPASGRDINGAVLADDGVIIDVVEGAAPGAPANVTRIDAGGLVLAPGLIDMRVFTGEPGFEYRETLKSASEAAAAGGVTSFVMMPDANPVIDDAALVDFLLRRARDTAIVNVLPSAAITKGLRGEDITEFGLLAEAGAVCFTDGRRSIASSRRAQGRLRLCRQFRVDHRPPCRRFQPCRRRRHEQRLVRDRAGPQGHRARSRNHPA